MLERLDAVLQKQLACTLFFLFFFYPYVFIKGLANIVDLGGGGVNTVPCNI
mgnify:CR=1 FL=1